MAVYDMPGQKGENFNVKETNQNNWLQGSPDYSKFLSLDASEKAENHELGVYDEEVNQHFNVEPVVPIGMDSRRAGLLAVKMGMTFVYDKWGAKIGCTVLQVDRCQVTEIMTLERNGVNLIQVGMG